MTEPIFPDLPAHGVPESPQCPFCEGRETQVLSAFGGQLSVAQCWCRSCRTGFEYLKWEAAISRGGEEENA
jgi:hypothetical protein